MKRQKPRPKPDERALRSTRPSESIKSSPDKAFSFLLSRQNWLLGILLVLGTIMAYQLAWHAGFIWDDDAYVTQNDLLTASDGLKRIWFSLDAPSQYFPLTYTMFRAEHAIWGLNPAGYHWINILIHAVNALLVWRVLKVLKVPGSWLAAAIFALHPVQVESVAWISEGKNVLSLFFFLLALLGWIRFIETPPKAWRFYALSLVLYTLALFSKTVACTFPAALVLILWLKQKPISRSRMAQIVPFVLLGVGVGVITIFWERFHQGTQGKHFSLGFAERLLIASHAIWFYIGKLLWPAKLIFSYPKWTLNPSNPLAYGWLVALAVSGGLVFYLRRFVGRSLEVGTVFFIATLSPLLGFIMLYTFRYSYVADHYQYAASIGLIALAAAGLTKVLELSGATRFLNPLICGALLMTLGVLTWRQCRMYQDVETLWRTTLARNPDSAMAHSNLGGILLDRGQLDDALTQLQKALELDTDDKVAYNNMGLVLVGKGRIDEAISYYRKALEDDPKYKVAHFNLAVALLDKGQAQEAVTHLRPLAEAAPGRADVQELLGLGLFQTGKIDEAIEKYERSLALQPSAGVEMRLGAALVQSGKVHDAIPHFQMAAKLQPGGVDAYSSLANLAWVLAVSPDPQIRNGSQAVGLAQQAEVFFAGKNPRMTRILAAAYAEAGRFAEAIQVAEQAREVALKQSNTTLAATLQKEIELYKKNVSLQASLVAEPAPIRPTIKESRNTNGTSE